MGLRTPRPYREFEDRVFRHRDDLRLLRALKDDNKRILGYGRPLKAMWCFSSCGIGPDLVDTIAEVNADKIRCFTAGHTYSNSLRSGSARYEPGLFPGAAMALQG